MEWSKKAETTTLNVNFKLSIVSSIRLSFLPWEGGREAGAAHPRTGVPVLPTAPWVCPPARWRQAEEGWGEPWSVCFSTVCAYLYLWKHFRNSVSAPGSCSVVGMDWELGITGEPAGAVQLLHAQEWEQSRSYLTSVPRWEGEKNTKQKSLDLDECTGFLSTQAAPFPSRSPSHLLMLFFFFS